MPTKATSKKKKVAPKGQARGAKASLSKRSAAKKLKVILKNERYQPEGKTLKAEVEEPVAGYGRKIAFNNRHAAMVDTGVVVDKLPAGCVLRFSLVERLAEKGMVLTTTAFSGEGPIRLGLVNCGREIVNILDGETIAEVWMDKSENFDWSV